jgi:hypothetical protein
VSTDTHTQSTAGTARTIFEYFIITAIIAVIAQTFLDEFSRFAHWSVDARNTLLFTGLFFDFLFSVEFTLRTIWSKKEKGFLHYLIHERGWIDFLSSFPLLLLDSGPSVYLLLFGHLHQSPSSLEVINIFKVIKAIRVTRILRLIRIVKIFGKIHNAESRMAQHHTSEISTIAVFTVIMVLLGFSIFHAKAGFGLTNLRNSEYSASLKSVEAISKDTGGPMREIAHRFYMNDPNILRVYFGDDLVYEKIDSKAFDRYYDAEDFSIVNNERISLYVSHIDISREIAFEHIQSFFIIVCIVLSFMIVYTRHFVQNISDVLHVMDKGFRKSDYNLQVKIRKERADHEVFKLASFYNDRYLPAKIRRLEKMEQSKKSGLSMKDLQNFQDDSGKK